MILTEILTNEEGECHFFHKNSSRLYLQNGWDQWMGSIIHETIYQSGWNIIWYNHGKFIWLFFSIEKWKSFRWFRQLIIWVWKLLWVLVVKQLQIQFAANHQAKYERCLIFPTNHLHLNQHWTKAWLNQQKHPLEMIKQLHLNQIQWIHKWRDFSF